MVQAEASEIEVTKQERLKALAKDIRMRMKRSTEDIYHIGVNLLEAQELLPHGEFLPWIQAEFEMGKSTAYNFMNVARAFKDNFPNFGNLQIAASALYQLASPHTPEEAREEALELAAAGEVINNEKATQLIKKHQLPATSQKPRVNNVSAGRTTKDTQTKFINTRQKFSPGDRARVIGSERKPNPHFYGEEVEIFRIFPNDDVCLCGKRLRDNQYYIFFIDDLEPISSSESDDTKQCQTAEDLLLLFDQLPYSEQIRVAKMISERIAAAELRSKRLVPQGKSPALVGQTL